MMRISIGILCGGKGRRMGRDKALLQCGAPNAPTFLEHMLREFAGAPELLVSVRRGQNYGPQAVHCRYLEDQREDCGPLEGIRRVLQEMRTEYAFICAVDMPFVTKKTVEYLEQMISEDDDAWVFEDVTGIHPACAVYSRKVLPVLEEQLAAEDYRIRGLLARVRTRYVSLEASPLDQNTLQNINTPEDYRKLCGYI